MVFGRNTRAPLFAVGLLALLGAAAWRQAVPVSLAARLDLLLGESESRGGFWGVAIYSLDRQAWIYTHDADRMFQPASNVKLFTTAAALQMIGGDYRYHTVLGATGGAADAQVDGVDDVVLYGSGDPSLSGASYPYRYVAHPPLPPYDAEAALDTFAEQLQQAGVHRIAGNVVGDDGYFPTPPYPLGWAADDLGWGYGAPISALAVNENKRFVVLTPASGGGIGLQIEPTDAVSGAAAWPLDFVADATAPEAEVEVDLLHGRMHLRRAAPPGPTLETVAAADPALFASRLLRDTLARHGIAVTGDAVAQHTAVAPARALAVRDSPPLWQVLQAIDKSSDNLGAELTLCLLGKMRGGDGSTAGGLRVLRDFLVRAAVAPGAVTLQDGSGLSRRDYASPRALAQLLIFMASQPEAETWRNLLPVAGVDGTLAQRLRGTPAAGRVWAKTGSFAATQCLSGYAETANGEHLVFSILANHATASAADVQSVVDRMVQTLVDKP